MIQAIKKQGNRGKTIRTNYDTITEEDARV